MTIQNTKNFTWIPSLLMLYNFCANLANDIYLPSMPNLVQIFSTSSATMQFTMSAWFAGVALPQLFFGPLTDKVGRRPVIFGGGLCFLIATAICASAPNVWVLIVARFFQGVGVCSLNVTTFSILIDLYNYKDRTQLMSKINMFGTMAPIIGPIIGGYIVTCCHWRISFVLIFILGLVSLVGLWFKLPESNLYLNPHALNAKNIYKNYLLLIQSRGFLKHLIPYCLILGGLIIYLTSAPFIIIGKFHISPSHFGYTQLPVFGAFILGSLYLAKVKEDLMLRKLLIRGVVLVCIGGILMIITNFLFQESLFSFILPMVVYSLGFSLCGSPLVNEVMSTGTLTKGSAAAFLGFGMAISCMFSSFILGIVYDGSSVSVAKLLFCFTMMATLVYFLKQAKLSIESEQIS